EVDGNRVGHIGFSYGGMIAILTAYEQLRTHFVDGQERFATHVSYYGPTVPRLEDYRTTGAPVAILNGRDDANIDLKRLDLIAQDVQQGGSPVDNRVFDGIYHQWDSDDVERRFDRFNIADLKTTIDLQNTIINEKTGRAVTGFASRTMMIARSVSLSGFCLQRDEETLAITDALLLDAMAKTGAH
ncbi:MAG: dienelactone hydrolase family protein, partial [Pseudomonadota bacterium]